MEKAGERVAMAILRRLGHRSIPDIELLIAGLGALPPDHGIALRGEEGSGAIGETEAGSFGGDTHSTRFTLLGQEIAEGDIVVAHTKFHLKLLVARSGKGGQQTVGDIVYLGLLAAVEAILLVNP